MSEQNWGTPSEHSAAAASATVFYANWMWPRRPPMHTISKMFSLACCVMLFYDIAITFGDEFERIWKQRFSFATVLWLMNRYLNPLGYIVIIVSFHADWPKDVCNRYVLYPEVLKVFTSAAIGVIFILRLYSIYGGSMVVLVTLSVLLVGELAVKIWAFTGGTSVNLPPGLVGCILTGRDNSNARFVFTWVAELIFDTVIFVATLSRTLVIYRRHRQGAAIPLIKIMMRDGIVYFLVIFVANVVTVTLFLTLTPDLKAVNASFSTLITSLMVSRLILNLRNQAMRPRAAVISYPSSQLLQEQGRITSTVIGNLGEPIENTWFDVDEDEDEDGDDGDVKTRDERDHAYGRHTDRDTDTYAMGNLGLYRDHDRVSDSQNRKNVQRQTSTSGSLSPMGRLGRPRARQILVEVTQTRSVTTDSDALAEERRYQRYPLSDPADDPDDLRLRRLDALGVGDGEGGRGGGGSFSHVSYSREDIRTHALGLGLLRLPGLSHSLSAEDMRRPRSAEQQQRSHSRDPTHVLSDENSSISSGEEDGCRSSSSTTHTSSSSRRHDGEGRTKEDREDTERGRRPDRPYACMRLGEWRPPQTWMLEEVDVYELGEPRRSRRRPSTS